MTQDFALPAITALLADDAEGTNPGWTAQSPWARSTESAASPTHSWTDSPGGTYGNFADTSLTSPLLDLSLATDVALDWKQLYDLEDGYDYGRVEISTDGGASWTEVARAAGENHDATWESNHLALPALAGSSQARLRFRLTSDVSATFDGWHLDDIVLSAVLPPPTGLFADGFESGDLDQLVRLGTLTGGGVSAARPRSRAARPPSRRRTPGRRSTAPGPGRSGTRRRGWRAGGT